MQLIVNDPSRFEDPDDEDEPAEANGTTHARGMNGAH
jgi:hypothetical protein